MLQGLRGAKPMGAGEKTGVEVTGMGHGQEEGLKNLENTGLPSPPWTEAWV